MNQSIKRICLILVITQFSIAIVHPIRLFAELSKGGNETHIHPDLCKFALQNFKFYTVSMWVKVEKGFRMRKDVECSHQDTLGLCNYNSKNITFAEAKSDTWVHLAFVYRALCKPGQPELLFNYEANTTDADLKVFYSHNMAFETTTSAPLEELVKIAQLPAEGVDFAPIPRPASNSLFKEMRKVHLFESDYHSLEMIYQTIFGQGILLKRFNFEFLDKDAPNVLGVVPNTSSLYVLNQRVTEAGVHMKNGEEFAFNELETKGEELSPCSTFTTNIELPKIPDEKVMDLKSKIIVRLNDSIGDLVGLSFSALIRKNEVDPHLNITLKISLNDKELESSMWVYPEEMFAGSPITQGIVLSYCIAGSKLTLRATSSLKSLQNISTLKQSIDANQSITIQREFAPKHVNIILKSEREPESEEFFLRSALFFNGGYLKIDRTFTDEVCREKIISGEDSNYCIMPQTKNTFISEGSMVPAPCQEIKSNTSQIYYGPTCNSCSNTNSFVDKRSSGCIVLGEGQCPEADHVLEDSKTCSLCDNDFCACSMFENFSMDTSSCSCQVENCEKCKTKQCNKCLAGFNLTIEGNVTKCLTTERVKLVNSPVFSMLKTVTLDFNRVLYQEENLRNLFSFKLYKDSTTSQEVSISLKNISYKFGQKSIHFEFDLNDYIDKGILDIKLRDVRHLRDIQNPDTIAAEDRYIVTDVNFYKPGVEGMIDSYGFTFDWFIQILLLAYFIISFPLAMAYIKMTQVLSYLSFVNIKYSGLYIAFLKLFSNTIFDYIPNPMEGLFEGDLCQVTMGRFFEEEISCYYLSNSWSIFLRVITMILVKLILWGLLGISYLLGPRVTKWVQKANSYWGIGHVVATLVSYDLDIIIPSYVTMKSEPLSMPNRPTMDTVNMSIAAIIGIVLLALSIAALFLAAWMKNVNKDRLTQDWNFIDEGRKRKTFLQIYFVPINVLKNLLISLFLVLGYDIPYLQILSLLTLHLGMGSWIWFDKPFTNYYDNIKTAGALFLYGLIIIVFFVMKVTENVLSYQAYYWVYGIALISCSIMILGWFIFGAYRDYLLKKELKKEHAKNEERKKEVEIKSREDRIQRLANRTRVMAAASHSISTIHPLDLFTPRVNTAGRGSNEELVLEDYGMI